MPCRCFALLDVLRRLGDLGVWRKERVGKASVAAAAARSGRRTTSMLTFAASTRHLTRLMPVRHREDARALAANSDTCHTACWPCCRGLYQDLWPHQSSPVLALPFLSALEDLLLLLSAPYRSTTPSISNGWHGSGPPRCRLPTATDAIAGSRAVTSFNHARAATELL